MSPSAVRVRTSSGWQDVAIQGAPGPPGPDSEAAGTVKSFAGKVVPTNWMLCDGRALSRTAYADLFAALGTMFGAGDGSTTFNIPDLRSRMVYGASDPTAQGATGGAATVLLTAAESGLPAHGHFGRYNNIAVAGGAAAMGSVSGPYNDAGNQLVANSGAVNASAAHNNLPPYLLVAQIIKVTAPSAPVGIALVTSLPTSPVDGQEVYYLADANTIWRLRYTASVADAYKWLYLGGAALHAQSSGDSTTTSTTFGDGSDPCAMTLPALAGYYDVEDFGCEQIFAVNSNCGCLLGLKVGAAAASEVARVRAPLANNWPSNVTAPAERIGPVAVSTNLRLQVAVDGVGGQVNFGDRRFRVRPVRVG